MKTKHLVVVGAGIAGLSVAYYWAKTGGKVTILEANTIGSGATWASGGMLCPIVELEFTEPDLLEIGLMCLQEYRNWADSLGNIGYKQAGTIEVALHPEDTQGLRRFYEFAKKQNVPIQWLNKSELTDIEPLLSNRISGGVFCPNEAQVDNRLLAIVLAEKIIELGGEVIEKCRVHQLTTLNDKVLVDSAEQAFSADYCVVTTGVSISLFPPESPRVYPIRGQMLSLSHNVNFPLEKTIRIRSKRYGFGYVVPKETRIIVGSTNENQGYDLSLTAGGMLDNLRRAYETLPGVYELAIQETWSGLRPAADTRLPFIYQDNKILYINGLFRNGILLAPWVGQQAIQKLALM
ncbi:MAG: glycine oxidase ThiO [Bacteroidia bacterium]|nr:glycine oxidase ThiO [Bacteroidia bacterium]